MAAPEPADLEQLLAEALARFDEGGEPALGAFVRDHPADAVALERGIRRCRAMGLLGTTAAATDQPERLGEFRLVRRIGGGGMGVVYEAVQEPLGRRVALKIIRPELLFFEGARERFRREIDAIARLEHPAIVSVYSAGEHEGVPFFTMELIDGITIDQACARLCDRDPAELRGEDLRALMTSAEATGEMFAGSWWEVAVRVTQQIALGLRHAHVRGIVHRDVKPSNVIVTPHGQAVVLDFGVAQMRAARDLTRSGAAPGSPAFMSPEQRRGQATDERTDVFSLAATAWHMLALQQPFREIEHGLALESPPSVRRHNRAVPPELDLVLRTAMDPDRERRYGDMGAFAADLQALLERRPIAARPLGPGLRALRWCQRHRTLATASALTVTAVAVMVVVLLVVQRSAQTALLAEQERTLVVQRSAQTALAAEQERTRFSLDTSLEALHSILVRLGNDQLRAVPQAERIAHGVLLDAAQLYRGLLQRHADDEKVRLLGGRALHALAMSHERQGEAREAMATLKEAIAVLGTDPKASPSLVDIRAHAWMTMASLLVPGGDPARAREAIDCAEADFAITAREPLLRAEALRARGELCTSRSMLHDERAAPAAVEQDLRTAVAMQRECMAMGQPNEKDPALLVMRTANLGKFLQRQARDAEARAVLEEALVLARQLPEQGTWPPPAIQVAEVQEALGSALVRDKDPAAEQLLRDSIAARERVLAEFPGNLEFRIRLGGALHNCGRFVYTVGNRIAEALGLFEQARVHQQQALAKAPRDAMALDFMGKHLEMIGHCHSQLRNGEGLAATAVALAELPSRDPRLALRAADFHLRAWHFLGKTDTAALDAAMAQLLAAEQRGLTASQLPARGFEALQERPDFRAWQERVRNGGKKRN